LYPVHSGWLTDPLLTLRILQWRVEQLEAKLRDMHAQW
jgi:hypothetical protein